MGIIGTKYFGIENMIDSMLYKSEGETAWIHIFEILEQEISTPCVISSTLNNFFTKNPKWIPSYIKYITTEQIKLNKKIRDELNKIYNNIESRNISEMKQQMFYTIGIVVENVIKSNFTKEYDEFFSKPGLKNSICSGVLKNLGYNFTDSKKKTKQKVR